jgi:hypothetical protein
MQSLPSFRGKYTLPKSPPILRLLLMACAVLVQFCTLAQTANAQADAALTAFPTFNGAVRAVAVNAAGTIVYVGGSFSQATNSPINGGNTLARGNLAAIDVLTGALITSWNLSLNSSVRALAVNGTRVYVGGDFTDVSGTPRSRVFSFDVGTNAINNWDPNSAGANGSVNSFTFDAGTNLYVAGNFTLMGGMTRNNSCAFDGTGTGALLPAYSPNVANQTFAVAVDGATTYLGGVFSQVNADLARVHFASVNAGNGLNFGWGTGLFPTCCVEALKIYGGELFVGGSFNPSPRNRLAVYNVGTGALQAWDPNMNGPVSAIANVAAGGGFVYAGGAFTVAGANAQARNGLASISRVTGDASVFNPNITGGGVLSLATNLAENLVFAGGAFTTVGGSARQGFAVFTGVAAPTISGFAPTSAYPMQVVTITGTNLNQAIGQVLFGGVPSPSIRYVNATTIEAVVPFGAVNGSVTLSNGPTTVSQLGFTALAIPQVATFVGRGTVLLPQNAAGQMTTLAQPLGMAFNATGDMFITESSAHNIRRVTPGGYATNFAGIPLVNGALNGTALNATFDNPVAVTFDGGNNLYVSDYANSFIRKIDPSGNVTTLAAVTNPGGLVFDGTDLVVVSQTQHCVYKVTLGGVVTTFAGTAGMALATDAMGAAARFNAPMYIAKDASNNFYVTDRLNHRIRKITPAGNVTTLAGSASGYADGLGAAAQFNQPSGIDVDAGGVVYIGDGFDLASNYRVRMIQPNGMVSTLAGTGVIGNTDGAYNVAQFPSNMAGVLVKGDTLFVSGRLNHDVRRIHIAKYQFTGSDAGVANDWKLLNNLGVPTAVGAPNFTGPGFQFILPSGTATATTGFTLGANCVMTVKNGATLRLNSAATNSGAMIVENGATLEVSNGVTLTNSGQLIIDNGATGGRLLLMGTGAVASTTPIYGDANVPNNATLESGGAAAKTLFVSELPSPMLGKLVISNTVGTTPPNAQSIGALTGTVTVNSGGRLIIPNGNSLAHNNATALSFTVNSGGILDIQGTGQISAAASPLNYVAGSMLNYSGAAAKTTGLEFSATMNGGILITNSNPITLNASRTLGATGTATINSGGRLIIPNGINLQHNNATAMSFTVNNGGTVEIQDAGQMSAAASPLNYVAGSTLQYSGTMPKTTTFEFPAAMGGNLLVTNTNILTLNAAKTLGASATLTLNGGRLLTTGVNMLTVSNTAAAAAITATTGYVDGPLQRDMPALLAAPGVTYLFPVGVGVNKYPFSISQPTTGATGPRLQLQAFVGNAGGTPGSGMFSLSTTEYWQLQQISGNYTSGVIYLERTVPAVFTTGDAIGGNGNPAVATGTYTGNTSTVSTGLTTASPVLGVGHFLGGVGTGTFVWSGAPLALWTASASWTPARTTPLATDVLQFNAGTHTPTNVPSETIQQLIIGGDVTFAAGAAQILTVGTGGVQIGSTRTLNLGNNVVLRQIMSGTVQVNGTLNTANSFVDGAGALVIAAGGTLATTSPNGINGTSLGTGAVQMTNVTHTAGANYSFNSAAAAINARFAAMAGKPAVTAIGTLTLAGMNDITLDASVGVSAATNVNLTSPGTFVLGANTLTQGAAATMSIANGARVRVPAVGSILNNNPSGTSFTVPSGAFLELQNSGQVAAASASDVNYAVGSTLEYSGTAAKTTTAREIGMAGAQQVIISNTMPVTLGANALIQQSLSINGASRLVLSNAGNPTLTLNGTLNQNGGANIASVNGANAGSIALGGAGAMALRLDPTDNTLNNFTVNRNGAHTITDNLNVRGTLDLQNGVLVPTTRILSGDPTGTVPGVITGGNTGSYVQGKLQRRFTANLGAGTNYAFPVGTSGTGYRPATLVNTLTGAMSPIVEMENYDLGATTFDMSITSLLSPRNWRVQTMSGNFNGSAITLLDAGISSGSVVARSPAQAGTYQTFGGNNISTTVTSNAGAVPMNANHHFAVALVQPTITSIMPTLVTPGDTISIIGTQLGGVTALSIGGSAAVSFQIVSPTLIRAVMGLGSSGLISAIYSGGVATSAVSITFNNAPVINSFSPTFGTTGATVRLSGLRLTNPSNVSFGGVNALSLSSIDATAVDATVGNGASGVVSVQTSNGVANSTAMFDYILKPSIVNFFPKWAKAGDSVKIVGGNFQRVSGVKFGNSTFKQVFRLVTNGEIQILMPSDASTGLIRLQNPVGTDSLGPMVYTKPPTVSSLQPSNFFSFGQIINITGTEFHPFPVVQIGSVTAATLEWTSLTSMRVTFAQATIGNLTIIASGGTLIAPSLIQVVPPPTVTSFTPLSPLPGDLVTVTGANFVSNSFMVRVNGLTPQNLNRLSLSSFTFTMPQTTTGPLVITTIGGATSATITFQPITVTASQPASALVGTEILLTGTRFSDVTAVRFGSATSSQFTVVSPTQIRVNVPAGATNGTISVVGPAGVATFAGFTILVPTPTISSFSPQMAAKGQTVTISGTNFTGVRSVSFGGTTTAQFTVVSPSQIRAVVPANAKSDTIAVVNGSGRATRGGFVFLTPAVDPNNALASFPTFNSAVRAVIVVGNTVYVGGDFSEATNAPENGGNAVSRVGLAAIDATTGALLPWTLKLEGNSVYSLVQAGDRIFAGGDFTRVNDNGTVQTRNRILAFEVATGRLMTWNPNVGENNGIFKSLVMDGGVLHAVGDFTIVAGQTRTNACSFDGVGGTLMGNYAPIIGAPAFSVGLSGAWTIIGGEFAQVNTNTAFKNIVGVGKDNGIIAPWNPEISTGPVKVVRVEGSSIYLGGDFTQVKDQQRNSLCAVDATTAAPLEWNPNLNAAPLALTVSNGIVYAGGGFTTVNGGTARNRLAAFAAAPQQATATAFNPNINADVLSLASAGTGDGTKLFAVGAFTSVGGQPRQGFAAFTPNATPSPGTISTTNASVNAPTITSFTPESGAPMQAVTLTGTRFTGASSVEFGDKQAWFKVVSPTEIQTVVPFGAVSGEINVRIANDFGSRAGFTVLETPLVSTLAGSGTAGLTDVAGQAAELNAPRFGTKIGNTLFFTSDHAIRKVNLLTGEVSTLAGGNESGTNDGAGTAARFNKPFGLLPSNQFGGDGSTHLLVADFDGAKIRIVDIASGVVSTFAGTGESAFEEGQLDIAKFATPCALIRSPEGFIILTDADGHTIRLLGAGNVWTIAGDPFEAGSTNGATEDEALLNTPTGIVLDAAGDYYFADNGGNTIRKLDRKTDVISTLSGTGEAGFADGASNKAKFNQPYGLAINGTTLFVADRGNNRIRAVSTITGEVLTVAGSGTQGFADGTQQAAQFSSPQSLMWDNGSLVVFDTDNNRIRRVVVGPLSFAPATGSTVGMTSSTVSMTTANVQTMKITAVSPTTLTEGSPVTLTGENISTNASVSIGSQQLQIISLSTTAIVAQVPSGIVPAIMLSTNARLVVTSPSVRVNVFPPVTITARDIPSVSVIFPNVATTRSSVSILGQFLAPLSASVRGSVRSVSIGGLPQAFTVVSPSVIQVTIGSVRSGLVQVRTLSGQVLVSDIPFTLDTTRVVMNTGTTGTSTTTSTMQPIVSIPRVAAQDSIALNRLFAATQGMQWATNSNWTNGAPVFLRFGVTIRNERVVEIRLPSSGMRGAIPQEVLQVLDKLEVLDLANNRLTGSIPQAIANAQNLEVLNLRGNGFTGALPQGFCAMGKLRELNLAGNSIRDSLASLCCLSNVAMVNLQGNTFTGTMPPCVQNMTAVTTLNLAGNGISGEIPAAIGQLRQLQVLNLRGNRFTGAFPRALGQIFTNPPPALGAGKTQGTATVQEALGLEVLDLGENGFTGEIPEEIGNLANLRTVLLDRNNLTGAIPKTFLNLSRLRVLDVSNNQLSGGPDLTIITRLDTLLVQNNRFSVVALERFSGVRVFRYLPQIFPQPRLTVRSGASEITSSTVTLTTNEPFTLSVPRTETFSRTEWRKDGIVLQNTNDTSRHAEWRIPALTLADAGVYDCVVTNERLPGIVLTTAQIQVRVQAPMILPTAVQLLEPRVREEDVSAEPRFRWTSSTVADSYSFELATDTSFASTISSVRIPQSMVILAAGEVVVTRTSAAALFARGFPLQNDRRYYWRVRAENGVGTSAWATGTFTTVPLNAELSIGTLDFGSVARRDTARGVVRIRNFGAATLRLDSIQTDNTAFVLEPFPIGTVLMSGGELLIRVNTPAEKIGNSVGGLTVFFRSGINNTVQERKSSNRLAVRVQGLKLFANPLDTVIVGRRVLTTVLVQNLSDEVITLDSAKMLNTIPDFVLQPLERFLEIQPKQFESLKIAITAQKEGEIPEEILQVIGIRGDILTTLSREKIDTVTISSRIFARRARPEDMFVRIGLKAVEDSVAPGGAVTLELSILPLGNSTFTSVLRAGTPSFTGSLRWNPNVLALSPNEKGVRPIRLDTSTSSRRTASPLQQFSLAPGLFWDGRSGLLLRVSGISVAGNTDVTPLILDNFQWGAGTVFIDSLIPGKFTAKACEAGGKRLVTSAKATQLAVIAPNPAKDELNIAYTLREDGFVEIALVNAGGNTAQILVSEEQAAGEYTLTKALKNVPSGSYTVRLQTSNGVVTKRVNVVR